MWDPLSENWFGFVFILCFQNSLIGSQKKKKNVDITQILTENYNKF